MAQEKKLKNYEESDAQFRGIFWSGVGLFAVIGFSFLLIIGLFNFLESWHGKSSKPISPLAELQQPPSGPRLQVDPELDLEQFKVIEDSLVNSYGWVQKEAGVVRIPLDEAMKLMLQRGFPLRPDFEEHSRSENRGSRMENEGLRK